MDVITHTLIAATAMFACYMWGKHLTYQDIVTAVVDETINKLETGGFIKTETDEDGDITLVPISEIEVKKIT